MLRGDRAGPDRDTPFLPSTWLDLCHSDEHTSRARPTLWLARASFRQSSVPRRQSLLQLHVQIRGALLASFPGVPPGCRRQTAGRRAGRLARRGVGPFQGKLLQAGRPRRFVTGQDLEVDRCAATVLWVAFSTAPATVKLLVRVGGAADFKRE